MLCDTGKGYETDQCCDGQYDGAKQQDHQSEPAEAIELHLGCNGAWPRVFGYTGIHTATCF